MFFYIKIAYVVKKKNKAFPPADRSQSRIAAPINRENLRGRQQRAQAKIYADMPQHRGVPMQTQNEKEIGKTEGGDGEKRREKWTKKLMWRSKRA